MIIGIALAVVVVLLVAFVILREFWTWYWKQSRQVELLEQLVVSVQRLEERGRPVTVDATARPASPQAPARPAVKRDPAVEIPPFPAAPSTRGGWRDALAGRIG